MCWRYIYSPVLAPDVIYLPMVTDVTLPSNSC